MDYPCGKFGYCSFSHFGSVVRTDTQTDMDERFTPTTLVGVNIEDNVESEYVIDYYRCCVGSC